MRLRLTGHDEAIWRRKFSERIPALAIAPRGEPVDLHAIRYLLVGNPDPDTFSGLTGLHLILSVNAGVDSLLDHPGLPAKVPIVRFIDPDLAARMAEYVASNVLMHHRGMATYLAAQEQQHWSTHIPPRASQITVGIMGLGEMGRAAVKILHPLGYHLTGWSHRRKAIEGVECFAGNELTPFLRATDILVCLLPLTNQTRGILNSRNLSALRRSGPLPAPVLINAGRGAHLVEDDLTRLLGDGTLGAASLDVFETEALPRNHPFWNLPNCFITPHVASVSDPDAVIDHVARTIADFEAGRPLAGLVDRQRGY